MLSNAYLVRASTAIAVLAACGCLVMSDIRAEAANSASSSKAEKSASSKAQKSAASSKEQKSASSSEAQRKNVLIRMWDELFRSSESLFPPESQDDSQPAEANSKKKTDGNSADREENISSNE